MYQWQGYLPEITILNGDTEPQSLSFNGQVIQLCYQLLPRVAGNLLNRVLLNPDFAMVLRASRELPKTYLDYDGIVEGGRGFNNKYWLRFFEQRDFQWCDLDTSVEFDSQLKEMEFLPMKTAGWQHRDQIISRQDLWCSVLQMTRPAHNQLFNLNISKIDTKRLIKFIVSQINLGNAYPRYQLEGDLNEI